MHETTLTSLGGRRCVRQAIASAIEKDSIIAGVYNNGGNRANSSLSAKVFGYNHDQKEFS
ncbi:hypothetical protein [Brevibacillus choshinensis]|uniref:Uncharacterized protein n=1 Tax=Brevibacillus choshinensis TaxID=54911 RepID=A0ABX7FWP6_BRECH|nr:hypothetical protein [Brevibacillus choshinensis]QRG69625.1 hypothetical protein JNE38_11180 [Brevibacillus choshinensis]